MKTGVYQGKRTHVKIDREEGKITVYDAATGRELYALKVSFGGNP